MRPSVAAVVALPDRGKPEVLGDRLEGGVPGRRAHAVAGAQVKAGDSRSALPPHGRLAHCERRERRRPAVPEVALGHPHLALDVERRVERVGDHVVARHVRSVALPELEEARVVRRANVVPLGGRQVRRLREEEPAVHRVLAGRRLARVPERVDPGARGRPLGRTAGEGLQDVLRDLLRGLVADDGVEAAIDVGIVPRRLVVGRGVQRERRRSEAVLGPEAPAFDRGAHLGRAVLFADQTAVGGPDVEIRDDDLRLDRAAVGEDDAGGAAALRRDLANAVVVSQVHALAKACARHRMAEHVRAADHEGTRFIAMHPKFSEQIPDGAEVILLDSRDKGYTRFMLKHAPKKDVNVVFVDVGELAPIRSRVKNPKVISRETARKVSTKNGNSSRTRKANLRFQPTDVEGV